MKVEYNYCPELENAAIDSLLQSTNGPDLIQETRDEIERQVAKTVERIAQAMRSTECALTRREA